MKYFRYQSSSEPASTSSRFSIHLSRGGPCLLLFLLSSCINFLSSWKKSRHSAEILLETALIGKAHPGMIIQLLCRIAYHTCWKEHHGGAYQNLPNSTINSPQCCMTSSPRQRSLKRHLRISIVQTGIINSMMGAGTASSRPGKCSQRKNTSWNNC